MAKTKQKKEEEISSLNNYLAKAKSIVFASHDGLSVSKMQVLRRKLKTVDAAYLACKKTLLAKAMAKSEDKINLADFSGSLGLAFGFADEVAPAKILAEFNKENQSLNIQGGILNNAFISKEGVIALAKLPGKQEMIARVVGTINAPLSCMVNVLAGNLRGLLNVLQAVAKK